MLKKTYTDGSGLMIVQLRIFLLYNGAKAILI